MSEKTNDTDDTEQPPEKITMTTADDAEARAVATAYDAIGVEFDVETIHRFTVAVPAEGREALAERMQARREEMAEATELAGETEQAGRQGLKSPQEKLDESPETFGSDAPDADWEPDEDPDHDSTTDGREAEEGNEAASTAGRGGTSSRSGDDEGNGSSPDSTTVTTSGDASTAASSTTSEPMTDEAAEKLREYPKGIHNLERSEAAKLVYGAIANASRRWLTTTEMAVENDDLPGERNVPQVVHEMVNGGILEKRELQGRTVPRCTYEYRIRPGHNAEGGR